MVNASLKKKADMGLIPHSIASLATFPMHRKFNMDEIARNLKNGHAKRITPTKVSLSKFVLV